MLDFPRSTVFNKRIPKQKFYTKLSLSSSLEQQFVQDIETIYWRNKLSPETLNVDAGKYVTEIEIIEINLKKQNFSINIVETIDREIPYHIVFILRYRELGQIVISYKESSKSREGKFKVDRYYKTDWLKYEELVLQIDGLNLDKVYENFMVQVADGKLQADSETDMKEAIAKAKEQKKIEDSIRILENKIRNEKQYNLQVKLIGELRKLRAQLEKNLT